MATLTQEQQFIFTRTHECFCGLFTNEDMNQAKRVFDVMTAWRNDEDETYLPRMLETFKVPLAEQETFLNWIEEKIQ